MPSLLFLRTYLRKYSWPQGDALNFKWQGWSNGGKNQNPKKSLDQNWTPKKSHAGFEIHAQDTQAQPRFFRLFCIPQKISTSIRPPKKYLPNFPTQKNPETENFNPKKILWSSLSLEIQNLGSWLKVFACFAQFQLAARTQLPKAGFQAPTQPCIADLSATVAKHARKVGSQFKIGFPPKPNTENILSLETLQISAFRPHYGMGNVPQLTTPPFCSFEVIRDFPAGLSCPPRPIFTLWTGEILTRDMTHFFKRCQKLIKGFLDFVSFHHQAS